MGKSEQSDIQRISVRIIDFSSVIFITAKFPQLTVQWNKYVKSMNDLNLKQNDPVEIIGFGMV